MLNRFLKKRRFEKDQKTKVKDTSRSLTVITGQKGLPLERGNGTRKEEPTWSLAPVLGKPGDLIKIVRDHKVHKVVVALQERRGTLPLRDLLDCKFNGVLVEDSPTFYEEMTGKIPVAGLYPSSLIFSSGFKKSRVLLLTKRLLDIVASLVLLIISLPISIVTAAAIKLDSKGPIIFSQERAGEREKVFKIYKFRSMYTDAEKHGPRWASDNDSRITRVGRIIRKLRIDEIPQLYNILKGDMSFVGPRPERPYFVEQLKKQIPFYSERFWVKPGLTGWAQINYSYGASVEDALEKLQYDLYYIKHLSITLDIAIILQTIKVVLVGRGAR